MPTTCGELLNLANQIEAQVVGIQSDIDALQVEVAEIKSGVESLPQAIGNIVEALINGLRDVIIAAINGVVDLLGEILGLFGGGNNGELKELLITINARVQEIRETISLIKTQVGTIYYAVDSYIPGLLKQILDYFPIKSVDLSAITQKLDKLLSYFPIKSLDLSAINQKLDKLLSYFPIKSVDLSAINQKLDKLLSYFPIKGADLSLIVNKLDAALQRLDKLLSFFPLRASDLGAIINKLDLIIAKADKILSYFPIVQDAIKLDKLYNKLDAILSIVTTTRDLLVNLREFIRQQFQEITSKLPRMVAKKLNYRTRCGVPTTELNYNVISIAGQEANPYPALVAQGTGMIDEICNLDLSIPEPVVAIPEWWPVRVGADRPQLVLVFKPRKADGSLDKSTYTTVIPRYRGGALRLDKPFIPSYRHGSVQLLWELKDNSKIMFYCSTKEEGRRLVELIRPNIDPAFLEKEPRFPEVDSTFKNFEAVAYYAAYYPNGYRKGENLEPEWVSYF